MSTTDASSSRMRFASFTNAAQCSGNSSAGDAASANARSSSSLDSDAASTNASSSSSSFIVALWRQQRHDIHGSLIDSTRRQGDAHRAGARAVRRCVRAIVRARGWWGIRACARTERAIDESIDEARIDIVVVVARGCG